MLNLIAQGNILFTEKYTPTLALLATSIRAQIITEIPIVLQMTPRCNDSKSQLVECFSLKSQKFESELSLSKLRPPAGLLTSTIRMRIQDT